MTKIDIWDRFADQGEKKKKKLESKEICGKQSISLNIFDQKADAKINNKQEV